MPGFGAFLRNLANYDAPIGTKVRLVLRNNATKWRRRSPCCGHPGEPGC